jgi:hypothetical protein
LLSRMEVEIITTSVFEWWIYPREELMSTVSKKFPIELWDTSI